MPCFVSIKGCLKYLYRTFMLYLLKFLLPFWSDLSLKKTSFFSWIYKVTSQFLLGIIHVNDLLNSNRSNNNLNASTFLAGDMNHRCY